MIYIGIDVAKDKHDCFITNSDSVVLFKAFTIANNLDGFNDLYQKIESVMDDVTKVKFFRIRKSDDLELSKGSGGIPHCEAYRCSSCKKILIDYANR